MTATSPDGELGFDVAADLDSLCSDPCGLSNCGLYPCETCDTIEAACLPNHPKVLECAQRRTCLGSPRWNRQWEGNRGCLRCQAYILGILLLAGALCLAFHWQPLSAISAYTLR